MTKITGKVWGAGLSSAALLSAAGMVASPANAYPPGTSMTVNATVTDRNQPTVLAITLANVQPGCTVSVTAQQNNGQENEGSGTAIADSSGTASLSVTLKRARDGVIVKAVTSSCPSGTSSAKSGAAMKERASDFVYVTAPKLTTPQTASANEAFVVTATNYSANKFVNFIAIQGNKRIVKQVPTNDKGFGRTTLVLPAGVWVIVASGDGHWSSRTTTVS